MFGRNREPATARLWLSWLPRQNPAHLKRKARTWPSQSLAHNIALKNKPITHTHQGPTSIPKPHRTQILPVLALKKKNASRSERLEIDISRPTLNFNPRQIKFPTSVELLFPPATSPPPPPPVAVSASEPLFSDQSAGKVRSPSRKSACMLPSFSAAARRRTHRNRAAEGERKRGCSGLGMCHSRRIGCVILFLDIASCCLSVDALLGGTEYTGSLL